MHHTLTSEFRKRSLWRFGEKEPRIYCSFAYSALLASVLIRCLRFDGLTLYGQGLTELEACDCANLFVLDNSAMVEDFLEL